MQYKVGRWVLLLWLGSCSVSLAASNTIMAGRSVGQIRLGESANRMRTLLGPAKNDDASMGNEWGVWTSHVPHSSKQYELDVLTIRDESGLHEFVEQVRVTSPWFTAHHGIHVGSSLSAVMSAFPRVRLVNPDEDRMDHQRIAIYDDPSQGITFEFATARHGVAGSAKCRAILVHPKRSGVLSEYAAWYKPNDTGVLGEMFSVLPY